MDAEGTEVELSYSRAAGYDKVQVSETNDYAVRRLAIRVPATDDNREHNIRIEATGGSGGLEEIIFSRHAGLALANAFASASEALREQDRRNSRPPVLCDGVSTKEASS